MTIIFCSSCAWCEGAAEQLRLMLGGTAPAPVVERKSYTREEKLKVVKFYFDKGNNLFQTSNKFCLNTKNILQWIRASSSSFPNFLFPITSQVTWPPCKVRCHTFRNISRGKLPTIPPCFTTETAYLWLFPDSGRTERRSPNSKRCPKKNIRECVQVHLRVVGC